MKLKSFGCSFIFGTDLADDGKGQPYATSSQLTWPALLAKDLNLDYECYARPGSGNLRILEKVLSISTQDPAIFVIGWSWIDRFDHIVSDDKTHVYDRVGECEVWQTIMPVDTNSKADFYYRNLHSQYRDKLSSLISVKTCIDTLKQKNISFIMTYMDELLFENNWHANSAVIDLQNYIKPYMTTFDGKNFLEFSKKNNFPISPTWHPLESAHRAAFELIKSYNLL
jgi:hypothetical protein